MSVPAAVQEIMARIGSLATPPDTVQRLDDRFAAMAGRALGSVVSSESGQLVAGRTALPRTDFYASTGTTTASADGGWVARIPNERGKALAPAIEATAKRYGLEPAFLAAVFWTESSYTPDAVSRTGAIGLGQLMPETAEWLGVDPWDPMQNMEGSARLYSQLRDHFGGDMRLAIASYAAGIGAVKRAGGVPDEFTARYIDKLMARTDYLAGRRATAP
jgi:soluble lytic murein transglycosylase-like protein